MKFAGLIATCSIVLLCSMNLNSYLEIQSTDKITTAIEETNSVSPTYNYNNYETHNYYEDDDSEKIEELEDKIIELEEKEEPEDETVLVSVNQQGVVYAQETQSTTNQDPWTGPNSYKCNRMAGYPAICGYCGERGEIHYNIKEWQDTQGTYHLTHVGCGQRYCDSMGVEPRIDEAYKIR